jgi:glycosyltransferase involved in cell wall biosynthesis
MKRVLRVIYDLQTGGVQRMILRSIPPLREMGWQLDVCCLKYEGSLAPVFRDAGAQVHVVPFSSRLDPIALWKLRRLVRREGYALVHSHMYASNASTAIALLGSGVPVISGYHSQTPFSDASQRRMARRLDRITRATIAVSGAVREPLLQAGVSAEKIHVVHNGVEIPEEVAPLPPFPLRLVWIGRFVKQKRPELALAIAEELHRASVDYTLNFVGEGPNYEKLKNLAATMTCRERVRFVGWQQDPRPFFQGAHLYLSTSDREGLPNTLLEAFAQGRGAVASAIDPNREVVGDSGAAILLPDSVADWVSLLRSITPEQIQRMGTAASERIRFFSIESSARKIDALYTQVTQRG